MIMYNYRSREGIEGLLILDVICNYVGMSYDIFTCIDVSYIYYKQCKHSSVACFEY